jgi:hypothetical protein
MSDCHNAHRNDMIRSDSISGALHMSHDVEHPVFAAEQGSGASERDRATLAKPWVTPKVITSTLGDTELNPHVSGDATVGDS